MSNNSPPVQDASLEEAARAFRERKFDQAGTLARTLVEAEPGRADAWNLLALAAEATGRTQEARTIYERGIGQSGGSPALRNNFATLLTKLGDRALAKAQLEETVARYPEYAPAWSNLASLLAAAGQTTEAEAALQAAVRADPENPLYLLDLAKVLLASGQTRIADQILTQADSVFGKGSAKGRNEFARARADMALAMGLTQRRLGNRLEEFRHIKAALEFGAGARAHGHFIAALEGVDFIKPWPELKALLTRAFDENWGFTDELGRAATKQLLVEARYRTALARVEAGTLTVADILEGVAEDRLLNYVLTRTLVTSPELERVLTGARKTVLQAWASGELKQEEQTRTLPLVGAMASQCHANDYAWLASPEELQHAELLRKQLEPLEQPSGVFFLFTLLGCYRSLALLRNADRLATARWPAALGTMVERQLKAPIEERSIRNSIRSLTTISNDTSARVKSQYEEHPYPLWLAPPHPIQAPQEPLVWLRRRFPAAKHLVQPPKPASVLVAGCGTGHEPVSLALALTEIEIKAIDLSLSSLAYANRRTRELGIGNIEYFQADIPALDASNGPFDIVVCAGVLHHLADPIAGWRNLVALTKPGGVLLIALYSALARRFIEEAREFATARGFEPTQDSLRSFRAAVYGLTEFPRWRADLLARDEFYSLAGVRDLVFHAKEQVFTIQSIELALEELKLEFGGFAVSADVERLFRLKFGAESELLSLKQWREFESDYPNTFSGMYHFLCSKPV